MKLSGTGFSNEKANKRQRKTKKNIRLFFFLKQALCTLLCDLLAVKKILQYFLTEDVYSKSTVDLK